MERISWMSSVKEEELDPEASFSSIQKDLVNDFSEADVDNTLEVLDCQALDQNADDQLKVFLRVRPLTSKETKDGDERCFTVANDSYSISSSAPVKSSTFRMSQRGLKNQFANYYFSRIFDETVGQKEFFDSTTSRLVEDFVKGKNGLVFTYGVTNAGKTYTLQGHVGEEGIIPRSVVTIFNSIGDDIVDKDSRLHLTDCNKFTHLSEKEARDLQKKKEKLITMANQSLDFDDGSSLASDSSYQTCLSDSTNKSRRTSFMDFTGCSLNDSIDISTQDSIKYLILVSFVEVYKESIYDLLDVIDKQKKRKLLKLCENEKQPFVKGAMWIPVSNYCEVFQLLEFGKKALHFAETRLNKTSSRSHCIFQMKCIRITTEASGSKEAIVSQISFCDLAGMERHNKTQSTGDRLKEAKTINTTMMTLVKCISNVRHNQLHPRNQRQVPYRESKLTRLFEFYLRGDSRACMLVNVSPSKLTFDETTQVLKFSAIASEVKIQSCEFRKSVKLPSKKRSSSSMTSLSTTLKPLKEEPLQEIAEDEEGEEEGEESEDEEEYVDASAYRELRDQLVKTLAGMKKLFEAYKQTKAEKYNQECNLRKKFCGMLSQQYQELTDFHRQRRESELEHQERGNDERMDAYVELIQIEAQEKMDEIKALKKEIARLKGEEVSDDEEDTTQVSDQDTTQVDEEDTTQVDEEADETGGDGDESEEDVADDEHTGSLPVVVGNTTGNDDSVCIYPPTTPSKSMIQSNIGDDSINMYPPVALQLDASATSSPFLHFNTSATPGGTNIRKLAQLRDELEKERETIEKQKEEIRKLQEENEKFQQDLEKEKGIFASIVTQLTSEGKREAQLESQQQQQDDDDEDKENSKVERSQVDKGRVITSLLQSSTNVMNDSTSTCSICLIDSQKSKQLEVQLGKEQEKTKKLLEQVTKEKLVQETSQQMIVQLQKQITDEKLTYEKENLMSQETITQLQQEMKQLLEEETKQDVTKDDDQQMKNGEVERLKRQLSTMIDDKENLMTNFQNILTEKELQISDLQVEISDMKRTTNEDLVKKCEEKMIADNEIGVLKTEMKMKEVEFATNMENLEKKMELLSQQNEELTTSLAGKTNEMENNKKEIEELESENEDLKNSLSGKKNEMENNKKKMEQLEFEIDELKTEIKKTMECEMLEKIEQIEQLESQNEDLKTSLSGRTNEMENNQKKMEELESEIDELKREATLKEDEMNDTIEELAQQNETLEETKAELRREQEKNAEYLKENEELQSLLDGKTNEMENNKKKMEELESEIDELKTENKKTMECEMLEKIEQIEQLESQMVQLKGEMKSSEVEMKEIREKKNKLEIEVENQKKQVSDVEEELSQTKTQNETLEATKAELRREQEKNAEYLKENKELQSLLDGKTNEMENNKKKMEELESEIDELKTENKKTMECEMLEKIEQIEQLESQMVQLKGEMKSSEVEMKEIREKNNKLEIEVENQKKQVSDVEEELSQTKTQNEETKAKKHELESEMTNLQSELADLNDKMKWKTMELKEEEENSEKEVNRLTQKNAELGEKYAKLQEEMEKTNMEIENLQSENEKLQSLLDGKTNEIENNKKKMEQLESENEELKSGKSSVENVVGQNKQLQIEIDELKEKMTEKEATFNKEIEKISEQNASWNEAKKEMQSEISRKEEEMKDLQHQNEKLTEKKKELEIEVDQKEEKIFNLRTEMKTLEEESNETKSKQQDQVDVLKQRICDVKAEHEEEMTKMRDEVKKVTKLENEQKQQTQRFENVKGKLDEQIAENIKMRSELVGLKAVTTQQQKTKTLPSISEEDGGENSDDEYVLVTEMSTQAISTTLLEDDDEEEEEKDDAEDDPDFVFEPPSATKKPSSRRNTREKSSTASTTSTRKTRERKTSRRGKNSTKDEDEVTNAAELVDDEVTGRSYKKPSIEVTVGASTKKKKTRKGKKEKTPSSSSTKKGVGLFSLSKDSPVGKVIRRVENMMSSSADESTQASTSSAVRNLHLGEDETPVLKKIPGCDEDEEDQFKSTRRRLRKRK